MDGPRAQLHLISRRPASTGDGVGRVDGTGTDAGHGVSERSPQARGIATRRALLMAAAEQIAVHGFHGTTLSTVLATAEVTKGSLYFHFESKETLAEAVIEHMVAGWGLVLTTVEARGLDPLRSALAGSDLAIVAILEDPIARGGTRLLRDPALPADAADLHWGTGETALTAQLGAASSAGLLRPGLDPARLARSVVAQITGHSVICDRAPHRPGLWEAITDMWCALLHCMASDDWLTGWDAPACGQSSRPRKNW